MIGTTDVTTWLTGPTAGTPIDFCALDPQGLNRPPRVVRVTATMTGAQWNFADANAPLAISYAANAEYRGLFLGLAVYSAGSYLLGW